MCNWISFEAINANQNIRKYVFVSIESNFMFTRSNWVGFGIFATLFITSQSLNAIATNKNYIGHGKMSIHITIYRSSNWLMEITLNLNVCMISVLFSAHCIHFKFQTELSIVLYWDYFKSSNLILTKFQNKIYSLFMKRLLRLLENLFLLYINFWFILN